jgi:hypothetical protein
MKSTKLLGVMILSLILAGCGGDTVNVDAAKYLDTLAVTADPPIPAPTLEGVSSPNSSMRRPIIAMAPQRMRQDWLRGPRATTP